jgi:putative ABC transport system permease protein
MLKNYIKIAFRNLLKHKFISGINLFGLTLGLTSCLLILAYVINELSYDRYNSNAENIYRVERTFLNADTKEVNLRLGTVAPPFGPLLVNDFKEIKKLTRLMPNGKTSFKYDNKIFNETDVYFADDNFFDVFQVDMIKGNPGTALADPFSVILSEEIAGKYFGTEDPLNKMVNLDNSVTCKVTGVYKSFPSNSHLHPRAMISFNTLNDTTVYGAEQLRTNWGNNSFLTYMVLPDNYDIKNMEARFPAFQDKHVGANTSSYSTLTLKKLTDIHLTSHTDFEAEENGDIKRVYIFSAIAVFILLIACINYMNLSTARSVLRAREIGVRKVVGARKSELIMQFLSESVLISLISAVLAFGLMWLIMPALNSISGQSLTIGILLKWNIIIPVILLPFIVGLLSGIYPALFLSSFKPVRVLKGLFKQGSSDLSFRKVLVILQFSVSIILIIATVIVFQQLNFMQNTSLGYNRDHIINLPASSLNERFESFKTELLADRNIISIARSSRVPTGRLLDAMDSRVSNGDSVIPTKVDIKFVTADEGYIPTYGIKIVAGRNFSQRFSTDSSGYLLNESAVRALGLSADKAIGRGFQYGRTTGTIIGITQDFHFESMHQRIVPLVLYQSRTNSYGNLSIKISGENIKPALAHLEKVWKKFAPEVPFDYSFLDDRFEVLYQSEQRQASIFTIFSSIAIFIACLGLFGLSAFTITQRIKEIGIRKVLGASVPQIIQVLSVDFLKLVLIAAVIGIPISWFAMHSWLEDFAYRIDVQWWVLVMSCMAAGLVAFITISFQAIKAAVANPVKSLRSE